MVGLVGRIKQAAAEEEEEEIIDEGRESFDVNDDRKRRSFAFVLWVCVGVECNLAAVMGL